MRHTLLVMGVTSGLAMLLAAVPADAAKLYKWVDAQGNVSYQDRPPPSDGGKVEERTVKTTTPGGDPALGAVAAQHPVVLYTTNKCAPCDIARNYLNSRKIPFTEKSAATDVAVQEELRKKAGALTVPTVSIGSKVITEYSQAWIESELDQAGYPKKGDAEAKKPEGEPPPN